MAILVLFEQFFKGKFSLNFLPLNLSVSPNMMHFVRAFSSMRAQGVKLTVIERVRNYEKIVFIKNMFESGRWGDASLPARTDNNVSYHYTNQPIWLRYDVGQILSQLL